MQFENIQRIQHKQTVSYPLTLPDQGSTLQFLSINLMCYQNLFYNIGATKTGFKGSLDIFFVILSLQFREIVIISAMVNYYRFSL